MIDGARANPLIARALFLRGFVLWLGSRAIASAVFGLAGVHPLHLPAGARAMMIAIAVAASLAQTMRLRERMLLRNLGIASAEVVGWFAAGGAAGEVLLAGLAALVP